MSGHDLPPEVATVAVVAERRHLANVALTEASDRLRGHGIRVELVVPEPDGLYEVGRRRPPWSLALSRGRDLAGLALLASASALGVTCVNHPRSIELVRNKIAMTAALADHDLPVPRTWFTHDWRVLAGLPADAFPVVVKPFDGDGAKGIALLDGPADVGLLADLPASDLYLAQPLLPTDGWDVKLYGIGARVWAVRKPSPVRLDRPGLAGPGVGGTAELVPVDAGLRDIALTCGRACGLDLWGVDVAMTPHGPYVIEVNDFPTYSAVPDAGAHIADLVLATLELDAMTRGMGPGRFAEIVRRSR